MNVGLLGTGLLGQAVAERLQATGHSLSAYNRSPEKTVALRQRGIRIASHAEEAMSGANVILLLLSDASAIRAVLFNPAISRAIEGRTIIQMGTIGPSESRSIQHEIARAGGQYLEAPVLGSCGSPRGFSLDHGRRDTGAVCRVETALARSGNGGAPGWPGRKSRSAKARFESAHCRGNGGLFLERGIGSPRRG